MSGGRRKRPDVRRKRAQAGHDAVMKCCGEPSFNEAALADCTKVVSVYHLTERREFYFMGRSFATNMFEFISKERPNTVVVLGKGEKLPLRLLESYDIYGWRFITGTPGAGKTFALAAAVMHLYGMYAKKRAKGDECNRRILFVDGQALADNPGKAMWDGLFQAFADDEAALSELETVDSATASVEDLESFILMREGNLNLTIVVDDGNKLGRDSAGERILCWIVKFCVVVFCASVSSRWTEVLRHPKAWQYRLIVGGLNAAEQKSFLEFFDFKKQLNIAQTGTVPRLMTLFDEDESAFHESIAMLRSELESFLKEHLGVQQREKVQKELTGVFDVEEFPLLLESKCFYRGASGKLEPLTSGLLEYAHRTVVGLLHDDDIDERWKQVDLWVQAVTQDDNNMARIGWNAGMAASLAIKFMDLGFYYATDHKVEMRIKHVCNFHGEMRRDLLSSARPLEGTAHFPYNHTGHIYMENSKFICAVQFSVAKNAVFHHRNSVAKAEELFVGDERIKVLVWVIHMQGQVGEEDGFDAREETTKKYPGLKYHCVKLSFERFCFKLASIDAKLNSLRSVKAITKCSSCEGTKAGAEWVQCDYCDLWYHQSCVEFSEGEEREVADFPPGSDMPYICSACRMRILHEC